MLVKFLVISSSRGFFHSIEIDIITCFMVDIVIVILLIYMKDSPLSSISFILKKTAKTDSSSFHHIYQINITMTCLYRSLSSLSLTRQSHMQAVF